MKLICPKEYTAKDGTKKTSWTTVGRVFLDRDGKAKSIVIDYLPTRIDAERGLVLQIVEDDAEGGYRSRQTPAPTPAPAEPEEYVGDAVPF